MFKNGKVKDQKNYDELCMKCGDSREIVKMKLESKASSQGYSYNPLFQLIYNICLWMTINIYSICLFVCYCEGRV